MVSKGKKKKATNTKSNPSSSKTPSQSVAQRRRNPDEIVDSKSLLDEKSRRDIAGVVFIILSVVTLLLAVMPSDALVSGVASRWMHLLFGIGCYVLPIVLLLIAITFFVKRQKRGNPLRMALGLGIVYISLLAIFALFAPISVLGTDEPSLLFSETSLINFGGYIGSAITWVGIVLFGRAITAVILVGLIIIGCVVVGFSISSVIEHMKKGASHIEDMPGIKRHRLSENISGAARVRRNEGERAYNIYSDDAYAFLEAESARDDFDPAQTVAFKKNAPDRYFSQYGNDDSAKTEHIDFDGSVSRRLSPTESDIDSDAALTRRLSTPQDIDDNPNDNIYMIGDEEISYEGGLIPILHKDIPSDKSPNNKAKKSITKHNLEKKPSNVSSESTSKEPLPTRSNTEGTYTLPHFSLLNKSKTTSRRSSNELQSTAQALQGVLSDFGIDARVVDWVAGPTVTLFEVDLPAGVRVSRITALGDDIALALASPGVRIFAPVPNTNYVGIEVPNRKRDTVLLSDVLKDAKSGPLQIAIGKDVEGRSIVSDLSRMPHLLIGGTTGSGKSVSINAMIMSILMRATPDEVRFILIDPKRVEFTPYNGIPHLYVPVVTEPAEAASALSWGVAEMERRLKVFSKIGVRNISQYNAKVEENASSNASVQNEASDDIDTLEHLPYIVIVIDELADLMMNIGKEVELSISRIAQLARAAGIHLIVATQRPSTNVVTGLIKANITNRIAFNVASGIDSRVILDTAGAENLIGLGDLLLSQPELAKPLRVQGCLVTEDEIEKVVEFVKSQAAPEYHNEILTTNIITAGSSSPSVSGSSKDLDPYIWDAADIVVASKMGSTSNIQRRLKVGYARAGRIMDQLEDLGIVGPANGSKPREVLIDELELESLKAFEASD